MEAVVLVNNKHARFVSTHCLACATTVFNIIVKIYTNLYTNRLLLIY